MSANGGTSDIVDTILEQAGEQVRKRIFDYHVLLNKLASEGELDKANKGHLAVIVREEGLEDQLRADVALIDEFKKVQPQAAALADAINEEREALEAREQFERAEEPKMLAAAREKRQEVHRRCVRAGVALDRAQRAARALVELHEKHPGFFGPCDREATINPPGAKRFRHKLAVLDIWASSRGVPA